jgi:glutamyl-tRNA reductase
MRVVAERVYSLVSAYEKQPVLVIGSSALARSVASFLARRDFIVYMTIRDTEKADLLVLPRLSQLPMKSDYPICLAVHVVISATKGMEYTLTKEQVEGTHLYIDLAPVRDIDPEIEGVVRIQDLDIDLPGRERETQKALGIIETACAKIEHYLHYRSAVPELQSLAVDAANDLVYRLQAPLKQAMAENTDLAQVIHETARKAFSHYLYAQKKEQAKRMHLDLPCRLRTGRPAIPAIPPLLLHPSIPWKGRDGGLQSCNSARMRQPIWTARLICCLKVRPWTRFPSPVSLQRPVSWIVRRIATLQ